MNGRQVHYELFVRRTPIASWTLDMASENREQVVQTAKTMLAEGRVAAVRVTKETLDPDTREFRSNVVLTEGKIEEKPKPKVVEDREPLCVSPQDLYTIHARDRIGRLLEGWLARQQATPFELLHRPDLIEKLDAAGVELQHAIQKIAIPEAQARGISTHELIRSFQALTERAISRVMKDGRRGAFPDLEREKFAAAAERLAHEPDGGYLLGGAVAQRLAGARSWADKISKILDLADGAPTEAWGRKLALETLEQPLAEILESGVAVFGLLGADLDLGARLAGMTRLAASQAVDALATAEPAVARILPPLQGLALRLAERLSEKAFSAARAAVGRLLLRELMGPKRLRPANPMEEIELLRGLGMAMTAAAGQLLPADDVQAAFAARSRMLVSSEFVASLIGQDASARVEVERLIWLAENVVGAANKREAARYLVAQVGSLRMEKEFRQGPESPVAKLAALAALQRSAGRAGLIAEDLAPIQAKLGELGGAIETDVKLTAALTHAEAPVVHRLTLLLRLAIGEAAPLGPVADRAREGALKILKTKAARDQLAETPEKLEQVRGLIQAAGLAG